MDFTLLQPMGCFVYEKRIMWSTDNTPPADKTPDIGLSQLREQTKNVMIPLLIRIFQAKLELQYHKSPPSRLSSCQPHVSWKELVQTLQHLDQTLEQQMLWIESSRKQLAKILQETNETVPPAPKTMMKGESHPKLERCFHSAMQSPPFPILKTSWKEKLKALLGLA